MKVKISEARSKILSRGTDSMNANRSASEGTSWIRFSRTSNHFNFMRGFTPCTSDSIGS